MPTLALKNSCGMQLVYCGGISRAAEYRKVIIGLIFLRYISAAFDKRYQELIAEGDGFEDDRDAYEMDKCFSFRRKLAGATLLQGTHTGKSAQSLIMQ